MRRRVVGILSLLLVALMLVPQFSALPGGIGAAGNAGCSCHAGGDDGSTTILVEGLPETFNASETYVFTITLVNDEMTLYGCLLYTSPSPRDISGSRMPSSA